MNTSASTHIGCHVNMIAAFPPGQKDDHDDITPIEQVHLDRFADFNATGRAYFELQRTKPQTVGVGLHDSPAGLLAWIGEKFHGWTHHDGDPLDVVDREDLLANVSTYWFTGTAASSARIYFEFGRDLVEGRVFLSGDVTRVAPPLAVLGAVALPRLRFRG